MSSIHFVDALLADADRDQRAERGPSDAEALDAYSQVVAGVAERVIGSVASLRINRRLPGGRQAQGQVVGHGLDRRPKTGKQLRVDRHGGHSMQGRRRRVRTP